MEQRIEESKAQLAKAAWEVACEKGQNALDVAPTTHNRVAPALMAPLTTRALAPHPSPAPYHTVAGASSPCHDDFEGDLADALKNDSEARSTVEISIRRSKAQPRSVAPPIKAMTTPTFQPTSTHGQFKGDGIRSCFGVFFGTIVSIISGVIFFKR